MVFGLGLAGRLRERKAEGEGKKEAAAAEGFKEGLSAANSISSTRSPISSRLKRFSAIALAIVVGTAIIVIATRRSNPGNTVRQLPVAGGAQGVDSDAHLYLAGRDSVMMALDEKALGEMLSALSISDQPALDALIESGRVLNTTNNTRVRVLQTMTGRRKVRILEGPHILAEGWVLEGWLR